jgi:hypothetical protein
VQCSSCICMVEKIEQENLLITYHLHFLVFMVSFSLHSLSLCRWETTGVHLISWETDMYKESVPYELQRGVLSNILCLMSYPLITPLITLFDH